jgi:TonB family protein
MRSTKTSRRALRAALPALLSLALHALAVTLVVLLSGPEQPPVRQQEVRMVQLSASEWDARRLPSQPDFAQDSELPAPAPPPPGEKVPVQGQVVDTLPGNNRAPEAADFLAETNNRVRKQTRARQTDIVPTPGSQATPATSPAARLGPLQAPKRPRVVRPEVAEPPPEPPPVVAEKPEEDVPGPGPRAPEVERPVAEEPPPASEEERLARAGLLPSAPFFSPYRGPLALAQEETQAFGANDALEDVEAGDETGLNTRAWSGAAYVNTVKRAWQRALDMRAALRHQALVGGRIPRETVEVVLLVTIDARGALKGVRVAESSGYWWLDTTLERAFERAQPFEAPPAELLKEGSEEFSFPFGYRLGGPPPGPAPGLGGGQLGGGALP